MGLPSLHPTNTLKSESESSQLSTTSFYTVVFDFGVTKDLAFSFAWPCFFYFMHD